MDKLSALATQRGGEGNEVSGRIQVRLNGVDYFSSNNRKLKSLVMVGLHPKHEANLFAEEFRLNVVGTLQLRLAGKLALMQKPDFCLI